MEKVDVIPSIPVKGKLHSCEICQLLNPHYNCPKCHMAYCSLNCYRSEKHVECSESFYQDQVMQHLQGQKCSEEEREKLLQILKDQSEEQQGDDICNDLSLRLENVDLNDTEKLWDCLTEDERRTFESSIKSDQIDYIEIWKPWWEDENKRLVQDIEDEDYETNIINKPDLSYIKSVPSLSTLFKDKTPDKTILFRLFDILMSYVFATRLYNGDHFEETSDFCETLFSISSCLLSKDQPITLDVCVHHFIENVYKTSELSKYIDVIDVTLKDLGMLLEQCDCCPIKVLHCLADVSTVFNKILQEKTTKKGKNKKLRKDCFKTLKNIDFLIAVVCHENKELLLWRSNIINLREKMIKERTDIEQEGKTIREQIATNTSKCLIKELS